MNRNANQNSVKSWLRLARISALPSAISNVLMGYLLAQRSWSPAVELLLLIASSSCFYIAGMILNDVFDVKTDTIERPLRPIPAGQISRKSAATVGATLLVVGVVMATVVGWRKASANELLNFRPVLVAVALAVCILLYDGILKSTLAAPFLMGGCRSLNVLLGASTISATRDAEGLVMGFPLFVWWVAVSLGIFIAGVTWLGRKEATINHNRVPLVVGSILIAFGLLGIALVSNCKNQMIDARPQLTSRFPYLIGLLSLPILRRVIMAVATGRPNSIQAAVIACLKSVIILDAALCFLIAPDQVLFAIVVIGLLIPSILLSRAIPPT